MNNIKISSFLKFKYNQSWYERKRNLVLQRVIKLLQSSTSHGIPNIFKTDRFTIRIIWGVCFLAAVSASSYMIFLTMSDYTKFNTVSKIEYISEIPTEFPSVSICNVNSFTTNDSIAFLESILDELGFDYAHKNLTQKDLGILGQANNIARLRSFNPDYGDSNRFKLGYDLNLIDCKFNSVTCQKKDFYWYFDINYGACYRFNPGLSIKPFNVPLEKNTIAGPKYGLRVTLFIPNGINKYSSK